jgi:hypothetical protein
MTRAVGTGVPRLALGRLAPVVSNTNQAADCPSQTDKAVVNTSRSQIRSRHRQVAQVCNQLDPSSRVLPSEQFLASAISKANEQHRAHTS